MSDWRHWTYTDSDDDEWVVEYTGHNGSRPSAHDPGEDPELELGRAVNVRTGEIADPDEDSRFKRLRKEIEKGDRE